MFKFIKQYAEKIDGISVYPLVGQLIFFTFFILVLIYVYRMKKSNVDEMKKYLDKREKDFANAATPKVAKKTKAPKVAKLEDLQADPVVEEVKEDSVIVDEMQITEVKETA
jgi:cbb3-type cytochrome oxidase subunit 3